MPPMLCENHRKIGTFYKEWYLFTLTIILLKIFIFLNYFKQAKKSKKTRAILHNFMKFPITPILNFYYSIQCIKKP